MKEIELLEDLQMKDDALPFKGIIFDMDGTLIASTQLDYLAWEKTFADYNRPLSFEQYFPLIGIKSADVIRNQLGLDGEELKYVLSLKLDYFKEIMHTTGIELIPFADTFLASVRALPVKIALATSSRRQKMQMVMERLNLLQYFDVIVTGEEVHSGKPSPEIFLLAASKLNIPADQCLVFEDAAQGVLAAKRAKMKCVAIATTHATDELYNADVVIDTFENLNLKDLSSRIS